MSRLLMLMLLGLSAAAAAAEPAVTINPASSAGSPLTVDENGSATLVAVALATVPSGTVQVRFANPSPGEVSLSTTVLTFTPATWNQLQTLVLAGVDDGLVDGDRQVTVAVTVDAPGTDYAGLDPSDLVVLNRDRQVPGLLLVEGGGTTVLDEGGAGDGITVALAARPAGTVVVAVAGSGLTATPAMVTFTTDDWNVAQAVALAAVDDAQAGGTRVVAVAFTASGSGYDGVTASRPATITDDDVAGVEVTPIAGLETSENGLQALVRLRLASQPTAAVTIPLTGSDAGEGTVAPALLTFTPQNWDVYQTVILTGVADGIADGDQPWSLVTGPTTSADGAYHQLDPADVAVINHDGDVAALVVAPAAVVVNQGGGTATIQVSLATQPAGDVTVGLVSSRPGEAVVAPASLLFTAGASGNWAVPQMVTVSGQPSGSSGDQAFTITATPTGDATYAALVPATVDGLNQDTSQPRVLLGTLSTPSLSEGGATAITYGVRLSTDPGVGTTITVTPTPLAGQVQVTAGTTLVFDHDTYATPQAVTIAAIDDLVAEGLHDGQIQHAVTGSFQSVILTVPIIDNDQAGIAATPPSGLETTETGGTATCTVRLASQPTHAVTIPLTVSDGGQGTVSPATLTFMPSGAGAWDQPQTVTITGADGNLRDDGDVPYELRLGPATSSDPHYHDRIGSPVGLVNRRVDNPPTLDALADRIISEDAGLQSIPLTGISDGQAGEDQTVTVGAASSNPALTGAIAVAYASPAATGTITCTPAANAAGSATITVQVGDGTTVSSRSFTLTVQAVNDVPVLVRATALVVGYRGTGTWGGLGGDPTAPGQLAAGDVETPAAQLVHRLVLAPTGGYLERDGVRLADGDGFTQAEVDAGRIAYTHGGSAGTSDGFVVRIEDGDGGVGDTAIIPITIDRRAPAVDLLPDQDAAWSEGGAAVFLAPGALVADLDSSHFGTGACTITVTTGGRGGDLLAIASAGDGAGQIAVAGGTVRWGGTAIGTITGGTWPTALVVTFNAAATPAAAQALLRQATWTSMSDDPGATTRTVQVVMSDELGFACPPQRRQVQPTPVNDAPVVVPGDVVTVMEVAVGGRLVTSDPDGPMATWSLVDAPTRGRITSLDAATGVFTYAPYPGQAGDDTFTVRVGDGTLLSEPGTMTVHITGTGTTQRPWFTGDAPLVLQAGDALAWTARVDMTELDADADLQFALEDAPAGMTLTADAAAGTAQIAWPAAAGSGHVRFRLRVWDGKSLTGDVQSVVIYIRPMPGGGG